MGGKKDHTLARLTPLALCLAGGAVLGQVLASAAPESVAAELRRILRAYWQSAPPARYAGTPPYRPLSAGDMAEIGIAYARCPLLALALGWTGAGTPALCVLAAAAGFSLSFAAGCFAAAYGKAGIAIAAAAMGIRSFITLSCFFLLALPFTRPVRPPFTRPRRSRPDTPDRPKPRAWPATERRLWRRRLETCGAVLAAGLCAEILLTPRLLRWALSLALP